MNNDISSSIRVCHVIVNAMRHCDMVGLSELVRENNVKKEKEGKERARGEMKTNLKNTRKLTMMEK